ncbi:hypothetical protein KUV62_01710 [Salipiger bermudensis]|uniref:hypothetical protein n=1 Tax=Salipiger bermudensis TaxID=344736 RepID=UPI001C993A4F|nr:hypothetical protein [Salipiger bermudensis]MBY6002603.1 hypothetical protein [Salipiger bermudensis]
MEVVSRLLRLFGTRAGRIGGMIRAALSVLGTDMKVFLPFLILFVLKAGRGLLSLALLYMGFVTQDWERAFPLMLVFMVYLPVEIVVQTLLQAAMSQMARDALVEGRPVWSRVAVTLLRNLLPLLFIGAITYLVRRARGVEQGGILGFVMALLVFVVAEVWDLVSNFGISAIVVENAGLKTLVARLKQLRGHVPETLVGVLGIDLAGGVGQALFAGGVVTGLFGGGALGYVFADSLPEMFLARFGEVDVNVLPPLGLLALSFTVSAAISAATVLAKSLYFTSLYLFALRPDDLPEDRRKALEAGLVSGAGLRA